VYTSARDVRLDHCLYAIYTQHNIRINQSLNRIDSKSNKYRVSGRMINTTNVGNKTSVENSVRPTAADSVTQSQYDERGFHPKDIEGFTQKRPGGSDPLCSEHNINTLSKLGTFFTGTVHLSVCPSVSVLQFQLYNYKLKFSQRTSLPFTNYQQFSIQYPTT